ncbi:hypothetical protein BDD12DRAFT_188742 [Trichophaea hybrida]|nr:hypothetical protein BDD12DRAFT_188742 [Trichophaea hybrida]
MPPNQETNSTLVHNYDTLYGKCTVCPVNDSGGSIALPGRLPMSVFRYFARFLDFQDVLMARGISRVWRDALQVVRPLKFPAVYYLPVELLQQIYNLTTPQGFNNARRTCRAWYISSLSASIQQHHLGVMGFSTDPLVKKSKNPLYLSRRLARECSLGADGSGRCDLRNVAILDLSDISSTASVHFTVSMCGSHALLCEGCVVYVYCLQPNSENLMEFVACIVCPRRVLAVSMDTSSKRYSVAILLVQAP